jgi:hypothetical protein
MSRPRPCWAPNGTRPQVASQLVREYVYLYGAVSPKDGTRVYLIMPAPDTQCFQIFLETLAKKHPRQFIPLFWAAPAIIIATSSCPRQLCATSLPSEFFGTQPSGKSVERNLSENP